MAAINWVGVLLLVALLLNAVAPASSSTLSLAAISVKGQRAEFASIKVEDGQQQARCVAISPAYFYVCDGWLF